jgi:hypothetical protein
MDYQRKMETAKENAKGMGMDIHTYVNYAAAEKYLESKGLKIITSNRQKKNGSLAIMDPLTNRVFALTKVGYIRTYVPGSIFQPKGHMNTYPLNPRNTPSPAGYSQSLVTFPNEYNYMATLLWKSILRIRKATK